MLQKFAGGVIYGVGSTNKYYNNEKTNVLTGANENPIKHIFQ